MVESLQEEWEELHTDFKQLEVDNKTYLQQLNELSTVQKKCVNQIAHQKYRIGVISKSLRDTSEPATSKIETGVEFPVRNIETRDENEEKENRPEKIRTVSTQTTSLKKKGGDPKLMEDLKSNILKRKAQLYDIEQTLPKQNGTYLKIILGNVNVSILDREEKFKYKDEYEKFKLILSIIGIVLAAMNFIVRFRPLELSYIFLLVWYYCTLTIRESILKVNGSRIKGWWRLHHFLSTVAAGILLIWPDNDTWSLFRNQFMVFNVYISLVQYLQFRYQRGVLYRLKALGERHNMDITIEGFHSWMWRGLSFLLPFLFVGYIFQFYNAYTLWVLSYNTTTTWHVPVLSLMFFILFIGNSLTTISVIPSKFQEKVTLQYRIMSSRLSAQLLNREGMVLTPATLYNLKRLKRQEYKQADLTIILDNYKALHDLN